MPTEKQKLYIIIPKELSSPLFIKGVAAILINLYKIEVERCWSKWSKIILTKKSKIKFISNDAERETAKMQPQQTNSKRDRATFYYCAKNDTALDVAKAIKFIEEGE